MDLGKILEKIYSEKDSSTNISIFIGSDVAYSTYTLSKDAYLSTIFLIGTFSLSKVISKIVIYKASSIINRRINSQSFSKSEKAVIQKYVAKGTCFITLHDLNKGRIILDENGLHSLEARGIIQFVDRSMSYGPSGFQLSEDIYKLFLIEKSNKS